jgi:peptidoglycan/xylan/chitin deacetylase (PgdA/CDA1 family)
MFFRSRRLEARRTSLTPIAMNEASIVARAWRKAGRISTRLVRTLNLDGTHPVRVPVLMLHKVGPVSHSEWWVSTGNFAAYIRALKAYDYTPLTFAELNDCRLGVRRAPRKPIIVTFDDGYRDILTDVLPVLQRAETAFKVTVFVPTGRVGADNRWDAGIDFTREPAARHLTWDEMREVARTGLVDFQAHTVTHPKLPELEARDADRELVESRRTLERELRRPIRYLSYPFSLGAHVPRVRDAVRRAGYLAAAGVDEIIEPDSRDPWNIRRLTVYANTTVEHRPRARETFLFGPTLLDDADVPRANCRDVRMVFGRSASSALAHEARAELDINVTAVFENPVTGVTPGVEIRKREVSANDFQVLRLDALGGLRRIEAGAFAETWRAQLPSGFGDGDGKFDARFVLTDARACVLPFAGDWVSCKISA